MNRSSMLLLALTAQALCTAVEPVVAQVDTTAVERSARRLPAQHISGPRFGVTAFTGDVARLRNSIGKSAVMTQFGWQFETRIVSTHSGSQALLEWVVLVGGVEQDELNIGMAWMAGYRLANGLELGVGPHVGVRREGGAPSTSTVMAAGWSMPVGEISVPLNAAVALAEGGPRITTLIGWIVG